MVGPMWGWFRRTLKTREIVALAVNALLVPLWSLNYGTLLQVTGLDRLLVHWGYDTVTAPEFIQFLQSDRVVWAAVAFLIGAFWSRIGHAITYLRNCVLSSLYRVNRWLRVPVRSRKERIRIAEDAMALSREIFQLTTEYDRNVLAFTLSGMDKSPEQREDRWTAETALLLERGEKLRQHFSELYSSRVIRIAEDLVHLRYINNQDYYLEHIQVNALGMRELAARLDALGRRLLADNSVQPRPTLESTPTFTDIDSRGQISNP